MPFKTVLLASFASVTSRGVNTYCTAAIRPVSRLRKLLSGLLYLNEHGRQCHLLSQHLCILSVNAFLLLSRHSLSIVTLGSECLHNVVDKVSWKWGSEGQRNSSGRSKKWKKITLYHCSAYVREPASENTRTNDLDDIAVFTFYSHVVSQNFDIETERGNGGHIHVIHMHSGVNKRESSHSNTKEGVGVRWHYQLPSTVTDSLSGPSFLLFMEAVISLECGNSNICGVGLDTSSFDSRL